MVAPGALVRSKRNLRVFLWKSFELHMSSDGAHPVMIGAHRVFDRAHVAIVLAQFKPVARRRHNICRVMLQDSTLHYAWTNDLLPLDAPEAL